MEIFFKERVLNRTTPVNLICGPGAEKAYLIYKLYQAAPRTLVVITKDDQEAKRMLTDLRFFIGPKDDPLVFLPPNPFLTPGAHAFQNFSVAERIKILYRLIEFDDAPIIITTVETVMQKTIPKTHLIDFSELLIEGEEMDRDMLIAKLIAGGYTQATLVEESGDFSVRGGILDVFCPIYENPIRIEWFGDMVDAIRFFSTESQRKIKSVQEAVILPANEVTLKKDELPPFINRIRQQASTLGLPVSKIRDIIEKIKEEGIFQGIERLLPLIYEKPDNLLDYFPENAVYILSHPGELEQEADALLSQASIYYQKALEDHKLVCAPTDSFLEWSQALTLMDAKNPVYLKQLDLPPPAPKETPQPTTVHVPSSDNHEIQMQLKTSHQSQNLLRPLADWVETQMGNRCMIHLVVSSQAQADRLNSLLAIYGIQPGFTNHFIESRSKRGTLYICIGQLSSGFVISDASLAILTEDEIFGSKYRKRQRPRKTVRSDLLGLSELKEGDIVVHANHGIGAYQGLKKIRINGISNDFLLILYKDNDRLYLPVDRMHQVQKYVGVDDIIPVLDKMGGKSWSRIKEKAQKEAEKVAGKLLDLYAKRKVIKGFAFSDVDRYFQDFEAAFPYEETADQLKAIDDVLSDMTRDTPMDRLICGDVGYGKTEVALRAAFKAVNDGKQVAVLVPTTVLAEQHVKTFQERFQQYPVLIEGLSRFRPPKKQREIIESLKDGKVDIVIGTHRLLQKDVAFKDLGLIIIDEEQRFGVKHKERLKTFRSTVDVLALTATPIPRTLHMSLMGIRDISIISTPPEERQAIITYISKFDEHMIKTAIQNELKRKGQVYFVHNNINTIENIAAHLRKLVPGVKLDIAHGRLSEKELEAVMLKFINKEIDLLVTTTIIESGLDIPSANTMLINRADRFGLAQIYQLRGRVGRAGEQAYAYLFIPEEAKLGQDAQKRLKVLMEHGQLGSGFQIAMSDLKIRGGGAALGVSQSGHIAAVGYDMFLTLMENAVADLQGKKKRDPLDPEININVSSHFPESYIKAIDQRMATYRRLAKMTEIKEITDLKHELIDRFGKLPTEATNLLFKMMLKILAIKAGVKRLDLNEQKLLLSFSEVHQAKPFGLIEMVSQNPGKFKFTKDQSLLVPLMKNTMNPALSETKNILKEIAMRVNG